MGLSVGCLEVWGLRGSSGGVGPDDTEPRGVLGMLPLLLEPALPQDCQVEVSCQVPCTPTRVSGSAASSGGRVEPLHTPAGLPLAQLCLLSPDSRPWLQFLKLVLCSLLAEVFPIPLLSAPSFHFLCLCLIVGILMTLLSLL